MENRETFSVKSDQYARHRPTYPQELFDYLSKQVVVHKRAWDCATGNGQAAVFCADYFDHVIASDISEQQIRHAMRHPKISYCVAAAENTPFANDSFDMILVAQAVHWFDRSRFYSECLRLLKPKGILAIVGYGFFEIEPDIDAVIATHLLTLLDPYWAEGNRMIMAGYKDLSLPVDELHEIPQFSIQLRWTMSQLLAYLSTWSAVKRFIAARGDDPVARLREHLLPLWQSAEEEKLVQMPLFVRVGRV